MPQYSASHLILTPFDSPTEMNVCVGPNSLQSARGFIFPRCFLLFLDISNCLKGDTSWRVTPIKLE